MDFGDSCFNLRDTTGLVSQPAGANTPLLTTAINSAKEEWHPTSRLTITVSLDGSAKFGVRITPNGGAQAAVQYFNAGAALVANALYTFTMAARPKDQYNFQVDTAGVSVVTFYVEGVSGGI